MVAQDVLKTKEIEEMKKEYFEKIIASICDCGISSEKIEEALVDIIQQAEENGDKEVANIVRKKKENPSRCFSYEVTRKDDYGGYQFMRLEQKPSKPLILPLDIKEDINNAIRGIEKKIGINRVLLAGKAGTGKTEVARLLAERLNTHFFTIDCVQLLDCKLGGTPKNIIKVFETISHTEKPTLFFFDEVDSIINNRTNSKDVEEMARVTTAFMRGLDLTEDNPNAVVVCATNLNKKLDQALLRRFDIEIDISDYDGETLDRIAAHYVDGYYGFGTYDKEDTKDIKGYLRDFQKTTTPADIRLATKRAYAFGLENKFAKELFLKELKKEVERKKQ